MSLSVNNHCGHITSHLFNNPLCSSLSLPKRVSNVMFHVLTLGIPLICYRIISYFSSSRPLASFNEAMLNSIKESGMVIPATINNISESVDKELIKFGLEKDIIRGHKLDVTSGMTKKIRSLVDLRSIKMRELESQIQKYNQKDNPWLDDNVQKTADIIMKTSTMISFLSLYDAQRLANQEDRHLVDVINDPECYVSSTLYYAPMDYHKFRSGMTWASSRSMFESKDNYNEGQHFLNFYIPGTKASDWRTLYNDYSDSVSHALRNSNLSSDSETDLILDWTKVDTKREQSNYEHPSMNATWWNF